MASNVENSEIFVTGGAGFIGSHLVDRLMQAKGVRVSVYDNLSSGRKEFIQHHLDKSNFKFIKADLLDLERVKRAVKGHDLVFHLAANPDARKGIDDTRLDLEQETIVTYNVLEAMRANKIRKVVLSSSGTIYGDVPIKPIKEDYGPALPISLYGAGKLASEGLISAFYGTFDFQAWIFRFANVVGSRATHGVIYDFINKLKKDSNRLEILGDGRQEKPYLFVDDCVDGMLYGLEKGGGQINVFNLGHLSSASVNFIAKTIVAAMGLKDTKLVYVGGDRGWPGDVPQYRCDVSKMEKLGWRARYNSEEAVKETIRCLLKS